MYHTFWVEFIIRITEKVYYKVMDNFVNTYRKHNFIVVNV